MGPAAISVFGEMVGWVSLKPAGPTNQQSKNRTRAKKQCAQQKFGYHQHTVEISFVNKLQDSLEAGVGNLVDADLAKESARLTALQTKQQLGVQALSIANSSSQTVLSLFR